MSIRICPNCFSINRLENDLKQGEKITITCPTCNKQINLYNILSLRSEECREVVERIIAPISQVIANIAALKEDLKEREKETQNIEFFTQLASLLEVANKFVIEHVQFQCYQQVQRLYDYLNKNKK